MNSRRMPSFIAVGPQRTGTTWLHTVLAGHAGLPRGVKEPQFFDRHYHKGIAWYAAHFSHCRVGCQIGEIAPTYFHSPQARRRIASTIPDCRIICTLRDPVERVYSLYKLMRQYGWTRASFEEALERHAEMLDSSRYGTHVGDWLELFGREQVLVMFYEDLKTDPDGYLTAVCSFLGIAKPRSTSVVKRVNESAPAARYYHLARLSQAVADWLRSHRAYPVISVAKRLGLRELVFGGGESVPPVDPALAVRLRARLTPEVERLEELVGRDLSAWRQ
jgi:LPS sulfotransferase NodH